MLTGHGERTNNYKTCTIRLFNNALAMASGYAKIEKHPSGGLYIYKIHDAIYHGIELLHPAGFFE